MKKTVWKAGRSCFVQEEILSDKSRAYNVVLMTEDEANISLKCVTCDHAEGLQIDIEHCVSIDVDHPVISIEAQKKIDTLQAKLQHQFDTTLIVINQVSDLKEQIGQADEVNDKLREDKSLLLAQNKALIDSLYAMWQAKEQEIMDNEDIVTKRDEAIVILHGRIGKLKKGIKELSDRFQESQHQEIKLRKELDNTRELLGFKEDL